MSSSCSGSSSAGPGRKARPSARVRLPALALLIGVSWIATGHYFRAFALFRQPAAEGDAAVQPPRRAVLGGLGIAAAAPSLPALAFETYKDLQDGVSFQYPTGLQKSDNKAYKIFLRDIVEPLECVGLKVIPTTRKSLDEIGNPAEVAAKLVEDSVPKGAPKEIIKAESKFDKNGRRFDVVEYAYQWKFEPELAQQLGRKRFQLHNKAMVVIDKKKQYLILASAEEPRWSITGDQLSLALDTFKFLSE